MKRLTITTAVLALASTSMLLAAASAAGAAPAAAAPAAAGPAATRAGAGPVATPAGAGEVSPLTAPIAAQRRHFGDSLRRPGAERATLPGTAAPSTATALSTTAAVPVSAVPNGASSNDRLRISDVVWSTDVADALPIGVTDIFGDAPPQICITWSAAHHQAGLPWTFEWELDGMPVPEASGQGTTAFPDGESFYACISNSAGLTPGVYEGFWSIDGRVVFADSVYVGGTRQLVTLQLSNDTGGGLCAVKVTPQPASRWGRNRLEHGALVAGRALSVAVPTGIYDIQALDCAYDVVHTAMAVEVSSDGPYALTANAVADRPDAGPVRPSATDLSLRVVYIEVQFDGIGTCSGSGTFIEADGTILTNSHVITPSPGCPYDRIAVGVLEDPDRPPVLRYEADILVNDQALDIAVIRVARTLDGRPVTETFPTIELGNSDDVTLGEEVDVIGYPGIGGSTVTYTQGTVSGFVPFPDSEFRAWIKTDTTISGGNSGGLAADSRGRIVGIPTRAGTDDGRITDCRVVADTNGDGRIDQNDACVPIGGFLNGIRPINVALPLIEQARTATPITPSQDTVPGTETAMMAVVSDPVWARGVTSMGAPIDPLVSAPVGIPELCLVWQYEGVPANSEFLAVWNRDGAADPLVVTRGQTPTDTAGPFSACISSESGIEAGIYELSWLVGDVRIFSEATVVAPEPRAVNVGVTNGLAQNVCVLQLSLGVTQTYGVNRIDQPLTSGATVQMTLPPGAYDMRVIDCDGLVLVEEVGGPTIIEVNQTIVLRPS